jgi:hypothetical protein
MSSSIRETAKSENTMRSSVVPSILLIASSTPFADNAAGSKFTIRNPEIIASGYFSAPPYCWGRAERFAAGKFVSKAFTSNKLRSTRMPQVQERAREE